MRWRTFRVQRRPGFRFNLTDLLLLLGLALCSWLLYLAFPQTGLHYLPLYIGITFFVFCNIFRVGNRVEPVWYVPFGLVMVYEVYHLEVHWGLLLSIFVPLQISLILYRIIRGPYIGVMYRKVGKYDPTQMPDY